ELATFGEHREHPRDAPRGARPVAAWHLGFQVCRRVHRWNVVENKAITQREECPAGECRRVARDRHCALDESKRVRIELSRRLRQKVRDAWLDTPWRPDPGVQPERIGNLTAEEDPDGVTGDTSDK